VQDPSGTTNMDFEFNQSNTISANGVTPVRTYRDMLIQYDLSNGGTVPILFLSFWEDGTDGGTAADCEAASKLPCWGDKIDLSSALLATGSITLTAIPLGEADGLGALSARTFGEASIDFGEVATAMGEDVCLSFGSAYLKSRSSDSFTSALKDFIAPLETNVSNCAGLRIFKQDDDVPSNLLSGAVFEVWIDDGDDAYEADQDGVDDGAGGRTYNYTCTTVNGTCSITGILAGNYWVIEVSAPPGHDLADPDKQLITIVAGGEEIQATFTNPRQPASVTINKEDDTGAPLDGATFTLYEDKGVTGTFEPGTDTAVTPAKFCTTVGGTCTISGILPPGDYCVDETTVPSGYTKADPQCFSLSLNQDLTLADFVDNRQPGSVTIVKEDDAGTALNGAAFTLYNDLGTVGTFEPGTDSAVTPAKSCTTSGGTCTIEGVLPGEYCVDETTVPDGYVKAAAQCFSIALDQELTLPDFVDPRKLGAIKVTKTRKHKAAENPAADPHAGVSFTVTDRDGAVIGSGATDANGVYCLGNVLFSQFAPGDGAYVVTETVPTGYNADQANPQEVSVSQAATCGSGDEATLTFGNTPLTDFTISINSQIDGGTQTVISCDNGAGGKTVLAAAPDNGDGSHTATDLLPGTYTCTIEIDP
jgi:hypothetical protein